MTARSDEKGSIRCPGCGHSCCPYKGEWQALECGGESDVVMACERNRERVIPSGTGRSDG